MTDDYASAMALQPPTPPAYNDPDFIAWCD